MTGTVTVTTAISSPEITGALWIVMTLILVVLLIGKEIVVGSPGGNQAWNTTLLVGIVPFTYLFVLTVIVTLAAVIR